MSKEVFITAIFFYNSFLSVLGDKPCTPFDINNISCSLTEVCDEVNKTCTCAEGLVRYNETLCIKEVKTEAQSTPNYSSLVDDQSGGSVVVGVLIPIILVALIMFSIYFSRKYHVVTWVRSKLNYRNENYDEFMIGQDLDDDDDDPPLR